MYLGPSNDLAVEKIEHLLGVLVFLCIALALVASPSLNRPLELLVHLALQRGLAGPRVGGVVVFEVGIQAELGRHFGAQGKGMGAGGNGRAGRWLS